MKKRLLVNVHLDLNNESDCFMVDKYRIYPSESSFFDRFKSRKHVQNAFIEFDGNQHDSILFYGGITGNYEKPRRRKLIEDILVVGSILTGSNWALYSRRNNYRGYPVTPYPYLEDTELNGKHEIEEHFDRALSKIRDASWQRQYENGFHLIMLLNHANIINDESRFLSNTVIWEWLFPHLINPNGATVKDESDRLRDIIDFILEKNWPSQYKIKSKNNIFHVLRNQLAHSGKLPINRDRPYVDEWMMDLEWESNYGQVQKLL